MPDNPGRWSDVSVDKLRFYIIHDPLYAADALEAMKSDWGDIARIIQRI
jgi:hypothetical protein